MFGADAYYGCVQSAIQGEKRYRRRWNDPTHPILRDRLIAGTVAATPVLMPFYFDYDLLLLAVPAALFAADRMRQTGPSPSRRSNRSGGHAAWSVPFTRGRWSTRMWPRKSHLNLSVFCYCALASSMIVRCCGRSGSKKLNDPKRVGDRW